MDSILATLLGNKIQDKKPDEESLFVEPQKQFQLKTCRTCQVCEAEG